MTLALEVLHHYCVSDSVDVLLYYSEGLLPFLQVFYSEFYQKGNYDQSELEGDTTEIIYTSLLVCKIISSSAQS